jgi:hypothetical protein
MSIKTYLSLIDALNPEDFEEVLNFFNWAFAYDDPSDVFDMTGEMLMERWNTVHGDKYTIIEEGVIANDMLVMVDLWNDAVIKAL